jgi:hypothetical protein
MIGQDGYVRYLDWTATAETHKLIDDDHVNNIVSSRCNEMFAVVAD